MFWEGYRLAGLKLLSLIFVYILLPDFSKVILQQWRMAGLVMFCFV